MDKNSVTEIISHFKKILETKGIKKAKSFYMVLMQKALKGRKVILI